MNDTLHNKPIRKWLAEYPVLADIMATKPTFWINQDIEPFTQALAKAGFTQADVKDAADRLERFRPYIAQAFPETAVVHGRIESPLQQIPAMHTVIEDHYDITIPGTLLVKLDSHLPISGSIKARGGIYEILKFAETKAIDNGLLKITDNYELFNSVQFLELFKQYSIIVGSTGNLGLSIGIIGAKLGFQVTVHMSADAKTWKKKMLRFKGVAVVEHEADYSIAVAEGREQAKADPLCHFVDDEDSRDLFLGYAVAAERLKVQLHEQSIPVDREHPLCVYLPCGVGGGPGGVTFGLKLAFGDNVHCFFGEPTQSPAMLVGLATGLHDAISAQQLGIANKTIADGLAVSRPSGLVCRTMQQMLTGIFTVLDDEMYCLLAMLAQSEDIHLEPSALVGFSGFSRIGQVWEKIGFSPEKLKHTNHLIWATGGNMVPDPVWQEYFKQGEKRINDKYR
ncbi:MAG: D-serine ammonia-lyase [Desulfobulbaceae bacterium]|nr:D-serine ammonia-lyase [Desulfobulbaceae bacterium]